MQKWHLAASGSLMALNVSLINTSQLDFNIELKAVY